LQVASCWKRNGGLRFANPPYGLCGSPGEAAVDDGAHVRLHDLRHFHGTMLVGAGVPLASVRDRLGHSSLTVTNIYVDGRPEWDRKSADIIGAVLDGTS